MKPYYIADKFHSDMPTAAFNPPPAIIQVLRIGIDGERRGWREEQY